ncbi:MAG: DegT/DnrJ/EryC1/StrS family aminotransferase [Candidatus Thermoplasmatota archaeon]|nr:DegT/DnrJ/EryC1/StrS family aminotransferase [Candidatus Thermoplasmatota archaeon]
MTKMQIPFFRNTYTDYDLVYTSEVIKRGMYWANGPEIINFENELAKIAGTKYALCFNSGTSAGFALLSCLDLNRDDEIIIPSFTFIATANWCVMANAKPVFADIELSTYGLDPDSIRGQITPNTKVIMPVHVGGMPCQIDEILNICEEFGLILIEDAAESLFSEHDGKKVGSFGLASVFSFTPTKLVSTGEGGAIVTNSKNLYESLKLFRSHGRAETSDYFNSNEFMDYISLGHNLRMPSIIAAQGIAQLQNIDYIVHRRLEIAERYDKGFSNNKHISVQNTYKNKLNTYQMYMINIKSSEGNRDELMHYLNENGIMSKVYFHPVHKSTHFRKLGFSKVSLPKTEQLSQSILSLPIYPSMSNEEIDFIIDKVNNFVHEANQ